MNFLDTADMYGPHTNEELVGRAIKGNANKFVIATSSGSSGMRTTRRSGALAAAPHMSVNRSREVSSVGIDTIDLYYQHRVDPDTPIEETVGAMSRLVEEGKVRYLGLSEASAESLRKACEIHPITALQSEYSLWTRDVEENDVLKTCRELGIGFVAYSPLGRGFLSGEIKRFEDLAEDDYRRHSPRFQGENFGKNMNLVEKVGEKKKEKGITASQLAIAWTLASGETLCRYRAPSAAISREQRSGGRCRIDRGNLKRIDEYFRGMPQRVRATPRR